MIGCDLSGASLEQLRGVYELLLQVDVSKRIPLADGSADAVVSSFFWEHLTPSVKAEVLAECHRVLKPSGRLVFIYDVETSNGLIATFRRRDPGLYRKLFLDGDRHVGYETPESNIRLFRAAGFEVLEQLGLEKTWLQSPSVYEKLSHYPGAGLLHRLAKVLASAPWYYGYAAILRVIDSSIGRVLAGRWARVNLVVCEKR